MSEPQADPLSERKLEAEIRKLEAETRMIERSRGFEPWKLLASAVFGLGGVFAAIAQFYLSGIQRANDQSAIKASEQNQTKTKAQIEALTPQAKKLNSELDAAKAAPNPDAKQEALDSGAQIAKHIKGAIEAIARGQPYVPDTEPQREK